MLNIACSCFLLKNKNWISSLILIHVLDSSTQEHIELQNVDDKTLHKNYEELIYFNVWIKESSSLLKIFFSVLIALIIAFI